MLVRLVKLVYLFPDGANVYALLVHLPCFLGYIKTDRACYSMLVKASVIAPEAMPCVLVAFKLAAAIAWHLF